jgi:hypothetical protein
MEKKVKICYLNNNGTILSLDHQLVDKDGNVYQTYSQGELDQGIKRPGYRYPKDGDIVIPLFDNEDQAFDFVKKYFNESHARDVIFMSIISI